MKQRVLSKIKRKLPNVQLLTNRILILILKGVIQTEIFFWYNKENNWPHMAMQFNGQKLHLQLSQKQIDLTDIN